MANSERRNQLLPPTKVKWKGNSKSTVERGCIVSSQQCEDKFNDLNRKYMRLNEYLEEKLHLRTEVANTNTDAEVHPTERLELNKMKLENEQLAFELKCLETSAARN
ncbi:unnamed protein product [Fraxinus pennsylvanica]|uniref:Uncharacterized protein n=1 Tax=Fraxinus pennsylvanica TaxID=56036 RepID=A0AAD1ZMS9_9LAMI|nr:unnamed protein product [Fraxinus pennsylvanica]